MCTLPLSASVSCVLCLAALHPLPEWHVFSALFSCILCLANLHILPHFLVSSAWWSQVGKNSERADPLWWLQAAHRSGFRTAVWGGEWEQEIQEKGNAMAKQEGRHHSWLELSANALHQRRELKLQGHSIQERISLQHRVNLWYEWRSKYACYKFLLSYPTAQKTVRVSCPTIRPTCHKLTHNNHHPLPCLHGSSLEVEIYIHHEEWVKRTNLNLVETHGLNLKWLHSVVTYTWCTQWGSL